MPEIPSNFWTGTDRSGGIPNPGRPDTTPAPHWRLEAIAATERPRNPTVSPDGRRVAFTLDRDTSDLWTVDLTDDSARAATRITTGRTLAAYWEDGGPRWSPDGQCLAYTHAGSVWTASVAGDPPREVCAGSSPEWIDDLTLVISVDRGAKNHEVTALAVVTVVDPWPSLLAAGHGDRGSARVSPDGSRVASTLFHRDDLNCTSLHVTALDSRTDTVLSHTPARHVRSPAWSPDGATVAFADETPGWYEVFTVPADGSAAPTQLTHDGADFTELHYTPDGSRIVAVRFRHGVGDLVSIDVSDGSVTVLAAGGTWSSPEPCADGSVVAAHESHDTPARICRFAPDGDIVTLFTAVPAPITSAPHVVPEHVAYRSLDGTEVYGWLYRPANVTKTQPAPAVVYPHGGPTSHTGDEWDGVAQYFVDLGYAWFSINFRGSTTYGRDFERANHGVWGVADTEDCLAAHDYLAGLDWVAGDRIGIFGASYGSYMALHSLVDDPQHRYACGVAKYGDCDIVTSWAQGDLVGRLDLERMMGHPAANRDAYTAGSPIHRVEQMTAPIFVAHGELDDRVHPNQSIELVDALDRLGKTYEYVTYPTEAHGLLRTGPFLDFYRRLERFFGWYLR